MSGVNKVILVGNVGKDPETRYIDNDVAVSTFSLATSETYKTKDGQKNTVTEWHNIVVWRGLAKVVESYVKKGDPLYIEGKIRTRSYDDKEGQKKYITEIVASEMVMLGRKGSGGGSDYIPSTPTGQNYKKEESTTQKDKTTPTFEETDSDDDLPF